MTLLEQSVTVKTRTIQCDYCKKLGLSSYRKYEYLNKELHLCASPCSKEWLLVEFGVKELSGWDDPDKYSHESVPIAFILDNEGNPIDIPDSSDYR